MSYTSEGHRRRTYGLTQLAYDGLWREQGGRCAICRRPLLVPAVDHDHRTRVVRGLLCGPCNRGLGHFQDAPDLCERAALYLR